MMIALSGAIARDERAHLVLLVGVEPVGRLVEDQHVGIVQQRLREPDAALEALGQASRSAGAAPRRAVMQLDARADAPLAPRRREKPRMWAMKSRKLGGVMSG